MAPFPTHPAAVPIEANVGDSLPTVLSHLYINQRACRGEQPHPAPTTAPPSPHRAHMPAVLLRHHASQVERAKVRDHSGAQPSFNEKKFSKPILGFFHLYKVLVTYFDNFGNPTTLAFFLMTSFPRWPP